MRGCVLDASALLALLKQESGSEQVATCIKEGAFMSSVNLSEVVAKFSEADVPEAVIHEILDILGLMIVDFDGTFAYEVGLLRQLTRQAGLSFGDPALLSLAKRQDFPAVRKDRGSADLLF